MAMTAEELFRTMAPLLAPMLERAFQRRDLCVLTTRVALDVAAYFGVSAYPVACQVAVYNAAFAAHVENGFADVDVEKWRPVDGSYSVGIGMGLPDGACVPDGRWDGHLIVAADSWFGDFDIWQAERPQHNIITGPAVVGPYTGAAIWRGEHSNGTTVEYRRIEDRSYRKGPDWRDYKRRRPIVAAMIRAVRFRSNVAQIVNE